MAGQAAQLTRADRPAPLSGGVQRVALRGPPFGKGDDPKVMTRSPGHLGTADGMIREMERMAEETVDGILVQGHGQYRPIHVFMGGSSVTVIDMDRSRPYDPAYDVVEFLVRMRKSVLKYAGS